MLILSTVFILTVYIYLIRKYFLKTYLESFLLSFVIFMGVNSIYLFFSYLFNLDLKIIIVLALNLANILIGFFFLRKTKNEKAAVKNNNNFGIFLILILTIFAFLTSWNNFENGFRMPIPSAVEDASQHLNFIFQTIGRDRLPEIAYPLSFHGNAWIFARILGDIVNIKDMVILTNILNIYIWFLFFLINSLFFLVVSKSVNSKTKIDQLLIVLGLFTFGNVVIVQYMSHGFFSNLFSYVFLLSLIYFLSEKLENQIFFIFPLVFGFFYSYVYLFPSIIFYFIYKYLIGKEKNFLYLTVTSILLFFFYSAKVLISSDWNVKHLLTVGGGYPTYSTVTLILCLIFSILSLSKKNIKTGVILKLGEASLFFSLLLAAYQFITIKSLSYSFYKGFNSVILILSILAVIGFFIFLKNIISKIKFKHMLFVPISLIVWLIVQFPSFKNELLAFNTLYSGSANFFSNNKEKYNTVVYALENFTYDNVIYIDDDRQASRWATLSYLNTKYNVIYNYENLHDFNNYGFYAEELRKAKGSTLILNPTRLLEVECQASEFIKEATMSDEMVTIHPPLDLEMHRRNCKNHES